MSWARKLFEYVRDVGVAPPRDLMTDGGDGPNRRIRVDVAQTGFFAGREFRTFKRVTIPNSSEYIIKVVSPVNFVLQDLLAEIDTGTVEISTWVGGTEGGSFADELPIISTNTMTTRPFPYYETQFTVLGGGTHTGGTEVRVARTRTNNSTAEIDLLAGVSSDAQGLPPGTYYIHAKSISGNIAAIVSARWEERP